MKNHTYLKRYVCKLLSMTDILIVVSTKVYFFFRLLFLFFQ